MAYVLRAGQTGCCRLALVWGAACSPKAIKRLEKQLKVAPDAVSAGEGLGLKLGKPTTPLT